VRVAGLIGVQLWGHYEATKSVASSQTRPRNVALIPSSAAVKVFAQHISVNVLCALTFPFPVTFTSRNSTLIFSEQITPETIRKVDPKVSKCGTGEGWRRSVGPIVWEMKCYTESRGRETSYVQWQRRKANWISHILRRNCLLKHIIEGKIEGRVEWREGEEKEVSSYWTTLRKPEDTRNWK
jgi:hypothetical protein